MSKKKKASSKVVLGSAEVDLAHFAHEESTRYGETQCVMIGSGKIAATDLLTLAMLPLDTSALGTDEVLIRRKVLGQLRPFARAGISVSFTPLPKKQSMRATFDVQVGEIPVALRAEVKRSSDGDYPPVDKAVPDDDEIANGMWLRPKSVEQIMAYARRHGSEAVYFEMPKNPNRPMRMWVRLADDTRTALFVLMPLNADGIDVPEGAGPITEHAWVMPEAAPGSALDDGKSA